MEVFDIRHVTSQENAAGSLWIDAPHRAPAQAHRSCSLRKLFLWPVPIPARALPAGSATWGEQVPVRAAVLDQDAAYSVNRKALKRWAEERLSLHVNQDGSLDALFRYDGTTCTNMGRPLTFRLQREAGPARRRLSDPGAALRAGAGDDGPHRTCASISTILRD